MGEEEKDITEKDKSLRTLLLLTNSINMPLVICACQRIRWGLINIYNGNYSDYLINKEIKFVKEKMEQDFKIENIKKKEYIKNKDERPKFSFKEQKEFETILI